MIINYRKEYAVEVYETATDKFIEQIDVYSRYEEAKRSQDILSSKNQNDDIYYGVLEILYKDDDEINCIRVNKENGNVNKCFICGGNVDNALWNELIKDKRTGVVFKIVKEVPLDGDCDNIYDLGDIIEEFPEDKFWTYSFNDNEFTTEEVKKYGIENLGARCMNCGAFI